MKGRREVRADARERAVGTGGPVISTRARFGFATDDGSSDDPRMRRITQRVSPAAAREILAAKEAEATEAELTDLVANALEEAYLQQMGDAARRRDPSAGEAAHRNAARFR